VLWSTSIDGDFWRKIAAPLDWGPEHTPVFSFNNVPASLPWAGIFGVNLDGSNERGHPRPCTEKP
jgi:hypothetical protein